MSNEQIRKKIKEITKNQKHVKEGKYKHINQPGKNLENPDLLFKMGWGGGHLRKINSIIMKTEHLILLQRSEKKNQERGVTCK